MMLSGETIYQQIGGETGLREFVDGLYNSMDDLPEVAQVRDMHTGDLSYARDRLFMFLSGMLGGPPLYMETFGHPRLRRRHLHFEIGNEERDQWLLCAQKSADNLCVESSAKNALMAELSAMANHLRNKPDEAKVVLGPMANASCSLHPGSDTKDVCK